MDIYIGATRAKLLSELRSIVAQIESVPEGGNVDVTIYGKSNSATDEDVNLNFSNDDMENRPDVADVVLVDVEE